ncbi:unnamed protein product [Oncorhynchus mykiss]|uniref:Uncharacterized protein n=1 Tax=Oncorhynchus mykiss TaxID=8022 RepID=A0A060VZ63_ONCMY|nr:unnamed protein product [Oncorhynchus mykiss]
MRRASKDVCRLREQSQKVPLQVQSFREKMAYFTRAKINIPSLPADDSISIQPLLLWQA